MVADPRVTPDATPAGRLETHPAILAAPLPTRRTLRHRRNPLVQLWRFAVLNARMGYIALRGHR